MRRREFFKMAAGGAALAAGMKPLQRPSRVLVTVEYQAPIRIDYMDISGSTELIYIDANHDRIQITSKGSLLL